MSPETQEARTESREFGLGSSVADGPEAAGAWRSGGFRFYLKVRGGFDRVNPVQALNYIFCIRG